MTSHHLCIYNFSVMFSPQLPHDKYFKNAALGTKIYILREKKENLPKARKIMNQLYYLDKVVKYLFFFYLIKKLFKYLASEY